MTSQSFQFFLIVAGTTNSLENVFCMEKSRFGLTTDVLGDKFKLTELIFKVSR